MKVLSKRAFPHLCAAENVRMEPSGVQNVTLLFCTFVIKKEQDFQLSMAIYPYILFWNCVSILANGAVETRMTDWDIRSVRALRN